jgi:FtsH-binding integral membrane protein
MALDPRLHVATQTVGGAAAIDEGLRTYMLRVYNFMAAGLAVTGIIAYLTSQSPQLMATIYGTPLAWIVMLAPLGLVMFMSFRINSMSAATAQATFWVFSALMGLSLAYIFIVYTGASITRVFFITTSMFAGMSLYGYTTKRDLSGIGSFLIMGLIGLIVASVVNIFLQSSAMHWAISVIGVLIFVGLTAYDTQKIRRMYSEADGAEVGNKKSIMGALTLYLDFINLFLFMLRLFGNRN